jgi:hypothetical protein
MRSWKLRQPPRAPPPATAAASSTAGSAREPARDVQGRVLGAAGQPKVVDKFFLILPIFFLTILLESLVLLILRNSILILSYFSPYEGTNGFMSVEDEEMRPVPAPASLHLGIHVQIKSNFSWLPFSL